MCDPLSLTLAATTMVAVGQGVTAYSSYQQAGYEAKVAEQNADLEGQRITDALVRGRQENIRFQRKAGQEMGEQRAALAANGIDPDYGSAAAVRGDTATFVAEDSTTILENANREARGYQINAMNFQSEASSARRRGGAALVGGAFDMGATVLGGAKQYKRMQFNRSTGGNPWG